MIETRLDQNDDPEFAALIKRIVGGVLLQNKPRELYVVEIKNWFDQKWLGFSGKGCITAQIAPAFSASSDQYNTVLDEFWLEKITVPPFTPQRVLNQRYFSEGLGGIYAEAEAPYVLHRSWLTRTDNNLHRRIEEISDSAVLTWYSSNTRVNRKGSLMVYAVQRERVRVWFASLQKEDVWKLHLTKGIARTEIEGFLS